MDKIEKIRKFVKELQQDFISIQPKDCSLELIKSYAGYAYLDKVLSFLDTLSEEPDKSLEEVAYKYSFDSRSSIYGQVDVIDAFKAGAEWQKEQMLKIVTKDDNLEEAGTQYVETYFRDIDWTPDVIKSCLEEAFISGGEYVFKQIKYE